MKTPVGIAIGCVLLAGCGGGGTPKPKPVSGPAKEVAAVIEKLQVATQNRDFTTICDSLLARSTRRQAGGSQCPAVLGARASDVRQPRIRIEAIAVQGDRAQVRVQTTAAGQAPTSDNIRLIRENGRFRIVALGLH